MKAVKIIWRGTLYHSRAVKWCEENVGQHGRGWLGNYDSDNNPLFLFDKETDATMFALRWK